MLRAMAATCASVSLLNGAVAFPPHPSSVAISQVSLVSLNSQRLQCDSIPENFNCNNKKEEFFKGFSSSPSSSSSSSSFSSSSLCGSTRLPLFFPQRCKERRLPLALVSKPFFLLSSSFVTSRHVYSCYKKGECVVSERISVSKCTFCKVEDAKS